MSSDFVDNYRYLARYNRWFNQRLYDACEQLADEDRKRDRRAFFGSIHNTLNHLVWADRLWLGRFAAQEEGDRSGALGGGVFDLPAGAAHSTLLYPEWAPLRAERARLDAAIEAWLAAMPPDGPSRVIRYANMAGVQREHPAWMALTHFFNHQTHHRGQVTALLMQAGIDPGMTDLIALPAV
jgi:uncharacterized damage-inducible protein DinB